MNKEKLNHIKEIANQFLENCLLPNIAKTKIYDRINYKTNLEELEIYMQFSPLNKEVFDYYGRKVIPKTLKIFIGQKKGELKVSVEFNIRAINRNSLNAGIDEKAIYTVQKYKNEDLTINKIYDTLSEVIFSLTHFFKLKMLEKQDERKIS